MVGTRRSARHAGNNSSSPGSSQSKPEPATGSKRQADSAAKKPPAKRGKKAGQEEQTTIEASMPDSNEKGDADDLDMKDDLEDNPAETGDGVAEVAKREEDVRDQEDVNGGKGEEEKKATQITAGDTNGAPNGEGKDNQKNGFDAIMGDKDKDVDNNVTTEGTGSKVSQADNAVEQSKRREEEVPSNILEKGLIYFFFRGRVGINEPSDVSSIARSYIVLRPIPQGAKLGDGPIGDTNNVRMLSLPKKVLPVSPKDRFMTFVAKANSTMEEIKQQLSSSAYSTRTAGVSVRHTPAAAPIGQGVYAITKTGRDTHLAYILTIPAEISEVQQDVGLRQRGSYFMSAKNPTASAPANASLPQGPDYPKEILDQFSGRGWMPLEPHLLSYENAQFLIIGHRDEALEKAAKPQNGEEQKSDKETPLEEIEKLEHEDEIRVKHLEGDAVFTDLGLSAREYPKVQTTW